MVAKKGSKGTVEEIEDLLEDVKKKVSISLISGDKSDHLTI